MSFYFDSYLEDAMTDFDLGRCDLYCDFRIIVFNSVEGRVRQDEVRLYLVKRWYVIRTVLCAICSQSPQPTPYFCLLLLILPPPIFVSHSENRSACFRVWE